MVDQASLPAARDWLLRRFGVLRQIDPGQTQRDDGSRQQHVRMFVLSHLGGPFIGLFLAAFLFLLGFPVDVRMGGFTALVCLFWAYPAALSLGVSYRLLRLASLQHLTFVILWASYAYGGLTSPFLLWLAIVPLLAFLYSAPRARLWVVLLAILGLNTALFATVALFVRAPVPADPDALRWLALLSVLSASAYVSMMAIYFGRVLNSRNQMAQEVAYRRVTLMDLDKQVTDLRRIRAAKVASLSRLVRHCNSPVQNILVNCRCDSEDDSAADANDLESIRAAALRLQELIASVEAFRLGLGLTTVSRSS